MTLLRRIVTGLPKRAVSEFIRHKLLNNEIPGIIVSIFVVTTVAHLLHQACRRIAQMKRHREVACLLYEFHCTVKPHIRRITLLREGKIYRTFG